MNGANPPRSDSPPPPPVALPDLELLRRIDAGSYGEVWLARTVTGALRAVKIVRRDRFETAEPFDREYAGITAYEPVSRTHDGLMDILHVGRNEAEGWFHYVMELADDGSESPVQSLQEESSVETQVKEEIVAPDRLKAGLRTYTARTLESEVKSHGRLPVARCVEIGVALADALHYLHQHELVHRDVKPANVIFVGGMAKLADPGSIKSKHKPHRLIGTEGYIPPEGPGRPQGDVFSLGRLLYETSTGRPAHEYPNAPSDVAAWPDHLAWLDLNEVIYAVGGDSGKQGELRGRNWRTGMELFKPVSFSQRVSHLAVSPDGHRLLTAGVEGKAYVYDATQGALAAPVITQQHHVSRSAFAPDGHRILTLSLDGTWRIWDLAEAARHPVVLEYKGHKTFVRFIDEGRRVLLGSIEGIVSEFDVESGRMVRRLFDYGSKVRALVLSQDGRLVAVLDNSAVIRIFDVRTGAEMSQRELLSPFFFASFDRAGSRLVEEERVFETEDFVPRNAYAVRVWNVTTGRDVVPPMLHSNLIHSTALSPDGRFIATACGNRRSKSSGYVQVWDLRSGQPAGQPITYPTAPRHVEFSANGQLLLISTGDDVNSPGWVELRNARTGKLMVRTVSTIAGVSSATFSPDGNRFLAARGDGIAQVYNTFTGEATSQEMPHGRGVSRVGFSPDGRRVFTSSAAGFSRWWDAQTGEPITPRLPHPGPMVVSTLGPDGRTLISAGWDDSARVWRLKTNSLPVLELDRLARLLTGQKLDAATGPEPVPPSELLQLWQSVGKP